MIRNSVILFIIALLIRILYIFFFVEAEFLLIEDQGGYAQLGKQFTESGFLGGTPERVQGYPFFISLVYSLFGESLWNVILVQSILDSISCVIIAIMATSIFKRGFWTAGVISAMNLNMIIISASFLTDSLFLFLFILFLFSLLQYLQNEKIKWFLLTVLFLAVATLVRASSYYLLPILLVMLVVWRLWKRDNISKISTLLTLYFLIVVFVLGGIHQRNYQQYGSTDFVSQTGRHIMNWVIPATYQYSGQGSYQEGQQLARGRLALALQRDQLEALPSNPFESSSYQANVGKDVLFELGFLNMIKAWVVGSTINLLAPSVAFTPALRSMEHPSFYETKGNGIVEKLFNYIKNSSGFLYLSILAVGTIISVIFTMLALVGVFKMISVLPPITVTTLLLLVGYFFAITGPIIGLKYRLPIEPILTLFATYAIEKWKK
jgi:4-amino-4-deoxy-L-arabinose transferase-like glycosyltransferase